MTPHCVTVAESNVQTTGKTAFGGGGGGDGGGEACCLTSCSQSIPAYLGASNKTLDGNNHVERERLCVPECVCVCVCVCV